MSTQQTLQPQKKKRRGPAPTGKGTPIQVRVQPDLLKWIDEWRDDQRKQGRNFTRPEAIRHLVEAALGAGF